MTIYGRTKYTNEDYLQDEIDRYRQAEQGRIEEEQRRQEQRRREFQEQCRIDERTADNWPEALRKQAVLLRREAVQCTGEEDDLDDFFGPMAKACDRALEIWKEIALEKKAAIEELEAQIALIKDSIRIETADRMEKESTEHTWQDVVTALREETPQRWLDW